MKILELFRSLSVLLEGPEKFIHVKCSQAKYLNDFRQAKQDIDCTNSVNIREP